MSVSSFQPTRFIEAAHEVAQQHVVRYVSGALEIAKGEMELLKAELLRLDIVEIPAFSATLRPRRIHAAVMLLTDDDVDDKAALVLESRPRASAFTLAWDRLRREYPEQRLEHALRVMSERCRDEDLLSSCPAAPKIAQWMTHRSLAEGAARDWEGEVRLRGQLLDEWLKNFGSDPSEAFHRATTREFLVGADAFTLRQVVASWYLQLLERQPREIRAQAMARYLNQLEHRDRWNGGALDAFERDFDAPQPGDVQNRYWALVNPGPRAEFRSWSLGRRVQDYFSQFADERQRGDFWRPFVEKAGVAFQLRCRVGVGAEYLAIGIEFKTFGVVEFGQVGNAAYLYPIDVYRSIISRDGPPPLFKDLNRTLKRIGHETVDGRLLHFDGWQEQWRPKVAHLLNVRQ